MIVKLAWKNTFANRKRTLAAVCGLTFAILLMFMQLGFLNGARKGSTLLYDYFDFDMAIVSSKYQNIGYPGSFDSVHLSRALCVPGVKQGAGLLLAQAIWKDPDTKLKSRIILIGVPRSPGFITDPDTRAGLDTILIPGKIMLDRFSQPVVGDISIGRKAKINGHWVEVASHFTLGMFFYADTFAVMSRQTLLRLTGKDRRHLSYGLLKIKPGADPAAVEKAVAKTLPDDLQVFTKKELIQNDQDFFISEKPVGFMFETGVLVAFCVGLVILFQVLSLEIANRMDQYATLKAIGFNPSFLCAVGLSQAVLFALMGYVPSFIIALGLFKLIYAVSRLPVFMNIHLALFVFASVLSMCAISSILVLRKVRRADPGELF